MSRLASGFVTVCSMQFRNPPLLSGELLVTLIVNNISITMKTMFHYTNLKGFESIINSKTIRLTSPILSNDKKEISWVIDLLMEMYPTKNLSIVKIKTLFAFALDTFYCPHMVSFSSNSDLLSQWRGYGDDGYGVSIGFDMEYFKKIKKSENKEFVIKKVIYNRNKQENILSKLVEKKNLFHDFDIFFEELENMPYPNLFKGYHICKELVNFGIMFKHESFYEESEIRLIHGYGNLAAESDMFNYSFSRDNLRTYIEIPLDLKIIDNSVICEIILGPKCRINKDVLSNFLMINGFISTNINIRRSYSTYQ